MANPELAKLQAQLREEIQSHQYVVGRIKRDPFNATLRRQLNERQMKIQALSDKQKWFVQDLRNELVKHEETVGKMGNVNISKPLTSRSNNQQHTIQAPKGSFKLISPPASSGQRSSHHSSSSHHGSHHSTHYSPQSRMSIMTNSPIKVPTFTTVRLSSGSNKRASSPTVIQDPYKSVASNLHSTAKKILRQQQQQQAAQEALTKKNDPESQKIDFMAALDLITPVMAEKLQRKRSERKRRTTANPQFSNYAKYEQVANLRRKSDSSVENGMPSDKRRRGIYWHMARTKYREIRPKPACTSTKPSEADSEASVVPEVTGATLTGLSRVRRTLSFKSKRQVSSSVSEITDVGNELTSLEDLSKQSIPDRPLSSFLEYFTSGEFDTSCKMAQGLVEEAKTEPVLSLKNPQKRRIPMIGSSCKIQEAPKNKRGRPRMIGLVHKTGKRIEGLQVSQAKRGRPCMVGPFCKSDKFYGPQNRRQPCMVEPVCKSKDLQDERIGQGIAGRNRHCAAGANRQCTTQPICKTKLPESPQDGKKARNSWTIQEKVSAVESLRKNNNITAITKKYNCSRTCLSRWNQVYDTLLQHNYGSNAGARRLPKPNPDDHGMNVYQRLTTLYHNEEEVRNVLIKSIAIEEAKKSGLNNFHPTRAWIRQWKMKYRF